MQSLSHSGRNGFRPVVEAMEERAVPTVFITTSVVPVQTSVGNVVQQLYVRISGDGRSHNVAITDNAGADNQISINTNGEAATFNGAAYVSGTPIGPGGGQPDVSGVEINFGAGNDTVAYNLTGFDAGAETRSITANLGFGNNLFTLADDGTGLTGANVSLNVTTGPGNDTVTTTLTTLTNARFRVTTNLGAGADQRNLNLTGAITANAVVTANENLGANNNQLNFALSGNVTAAAGEHTAVTLNVNGGAQNDVVNAALNGGISISGAVTVTGNLAAGNDVFNGSYAAGTNILFTDANNLGRVRFDVDGGLGNDTLTVTGNGQATINGRLESFLRGGAGADAIVVTTPATDGLVLNGNGAGVVKGTYRLRLDGGTGDDLITTTLSNTAGGNNAGDNGNYDIQVLGGDGVDAVQFGLVDPSNTDPTIGVTYLPGLTNPNSVGVATPAGTILLDGGFPSPDQTSPLFRNNRLTIQPTTTTKALNAVLVRNFVF